MDDHIRKLNIKIRNKETELNELFTKTQKLEEVIATLHHKEASQYLLFEPLNTPQA